ncbi:MAG: hypothetical protein EAY81_11125 [Bacteroidetes bacterium]|nr:MAG: hypothetical protein EAY81_11125 [Bacteroidota bacterium]
MTFKKYAIQGLFCTLLFGITACSKYERNNPNDLLNASGTPNVVIAGYEVISDNNSDRKLQKGETAGIYVELKNTGTKLAQIKTVEFVSKSPKVTINGFEISKTTTSYVGKPTYIGVLRVVLAKDVTEGQTFTCEAKLTDTEGNVFNTQLTLTVSAAKQSIFSLASVAVRGQNYVRGTEYSYSKGLTPLVKLVMGNNSGKDYIDDIVVKITSLNAAYPFEHTITYGLAIPVTSSWQVDIPSNDCFPQNIPDNTVLPVMISVTDKDGGYIEKETSVTIRPNTAKLDFTLFSIVSGSRLPGNRLTVSMDVTNSGVRDLKFSPSKVKITSTSSYLNSFNVFGSFIEFIDRGDFAEGFCTFGFDIAPNCPNGIEIPIDVEVTTEEPCPTTFKTTVNVTVD